MNGPKVIRCPRGDIIQPYAGNSHVSPNAARYGVGTISRKDPASSSDYAAESSETLRWTSLKFC